MSSDQSTTPENNLSQRPNAVYDVHAEAKKVGEVEDTDDSDLNNSFNQVIMLFAFDVVLSRFLKIRNCESQFLLPISEMRNRESEKRILFN